MGQITRACASHREIDVVRAVHVLAPPAARSSQDKHLLSVSVENTNVGFPERSSANQSTNYSHQLQYTDKSSTPH